MLKEDSERRILRGEGKGKEEMVSISSTSSSDDGRKRNRREGICVGRGNRVVLR